MRGQLRGGNCHNLFFGAVKRGAAGLFIEHQLAASIHSVALRMVLFGTNGIALQLLFALHVVGAKESILIQCGREKDFAHNVYHLREQLFALTSAVGQVFFAKHVGAKTKHLRVSTVEVAHRKLGAKQIIEATVDGGNIGIALGAAQKNGQQKRGHIRLLPLYRQHSRKREHFGFEFFCLTQPQRKRWAQSQLNRSHIVFLCL